MVSQVAYGLVAVSPRALFIYHTSSDTALIFVYVDNILASNYDLLSQVISFIYIAFAIHELGKPSFFLGLQVQYIGGAMHLSQSKYIQDFLERTHLDDSKPTPTPGCSSWSISQTDGAPLHNPTEYRSIVGALQYATLTQPNIAFVNRLFQSSSSLQLQGYSDADQASCLDDRRSTSGLCVYLGANLISWSSTKQRIVSKSSVESEYRSLVSLSAELVWIQAFLQELSFPIPTPIVWCDNQSARHLAHNPILHS